MKTSLAVASVLACGAMATALAAPPPAAAPLRADHPLIGAWEITSRENGCVETYRIDRGGSTLVTSADEVAETRFTLADQPSAKGFFKWVDTLVKDNGKKDCSGQVTKLPHTSTTYILLNPTGDRFLMCTAEDGRQCIGPFVRVQGGEI